MEMFVGVGASRVRDMFAQARKAVSLVALHCVVCAYQVHRQWPAPADASQGSCASARYACCVIARPGQAGMLLSLLVQPKRACLPCCCRPRRPAPCSPTPTARTELYPVHVCRKQQCLTPLVFPIPQAPSILFTDQAADMAPSPDSTMPAPLPLKP